VDQSRFAQAIVAKDSPRALQDNKLAVSVGMILEQDRGAGNRSGNCSGGNLSAARIFRHAQEHGTAAEVEVTRPFVKAEDRVSSEAGERLIGKGKFGTLFNPGADSGAIAHGVSQPSLPRSRFVREDLYIADNLANARLL